jgi:tRNA threonylcarbamoyl adenosine modification protein (Sua5/YciO/YrdC/YwlC family)
VLDDGELVVLPTESAYGVACDAFSAEGLVAMRTAKGNRRLVPPVLIGNSRTLDGLASEVPRATRELAEAFWPGPLTLVCHAQPTLDWDLGGPDAAVSLRMPLHPVTLELLSVTGPLALTGANAAGHPLPISYEQAQEQLGGLVAVYLDVGELEPRGASTVVDGRGELPRVLREGALTLEELREVVPGLLDVGQEVSG